MAMAANAKPNMGNMCRRCHSSRRMQMPTGQATGESADLFSYIGSFGGACDKTSLGQSEMLLMCLKRGKSRYNGPASETLGTSRQTRRAGDLSRGARSSRAVVCQGAGYLRCWL